MSQNENSGKACPIHLYDAPFEIQSLEDQHCTYSQTLHWKTLLLYKSVLFQVTPFIFPVTLRSIPVTLDFCRRPRSRERDRLRRCRGRGRGRRIR